MDRTPLAASILLLAAVSVVVCSEAHAQIPTFPSDPAAIPATIPSVRARPPVDAAALEGAVDPAEYVVGPGDVFTITIGGARAFARQVSATVSADGRLAIPEAGSFEAAGQTLAAVLARVRPAVRRNFQNVPTDVTLSEPRRFIVHVSGAVRDPGRHVVRAVGRVEDALVAASLNTSVGTLMEYGVPEAGKTLRPAFRNVSVERESGPSLSVDLARYVATGDPRFNPHLRDGDRVRLPAFAPRQEGVFVGGTVLRPGVYDLRPDDTVAVLAEVAGAPEGASFRLTPAGGPARMLSPAEAASTPVGPRDQIAVADPDPLAGAAEVEGGVAFPGAFPIRNGQTTVGVLVELAGGLAPDALPRAAYLERTLLSPDSAEVADLRSDGLDLLGQLYYRQEAARTPRVGLDLTSAASVEVVVRDGDRLVIPRGDNGVRVFGAVARPGFVPYSPGRSATAYVERAGGLTEAATGVWVVEAGTGRLVPYPDRALEPGDAVFAAREVLADTPQGAQITLQQRQAEREENRALREEQRDARQARFQLFQTVISAAGVVVSAIIAVSALNNSN